MWYTARLKGAVVGPHSVRLQTPRPDNIGANESFEETIPVELVEESGLITAEVEDRANVINFIQRTCP